MLLIINPLIILNMKIQSLIYIFTFFILFSCKNDKKEEVISNKTTQNNFYPITIGNQWVYKSIHQIDSENVRIVQDTSIHNWSVLKDTLLNSHLAYKFYQEHNSPLYGHNIAYTYYSSLNDGFYSLGTINYGSNLFFKTGKNTVGYLEHSIQLMKYPVVWNDIWDSNEFGNSIRFVRTWIKDTTISTSAGIFLCKQLKSFLDSDFDNQPDTTSVIVTQFFNEQKGLIREIKEQKLSSINLSGYIFEGYFKNETNLESVNF